MANCPMCDVQTGQRHKFGCDIERCPCCGDQAESCGCVYENHRFVPWSGEWPGKAECRQYGFYAKMVEGKGWQVCGPDENGATEDLNTLVTKGRWDTEAQRWVVPS